MWLVVFEFENEHLFKLLQAPNVQLIIILRMIFPRPDFTLQQD